MQNAQQSQMQAQQDNLSAFLRYAPEVILETPLIGTLATGSAGGSLAQFSFPNRIPRVPAWLTEIWVTTTMVVTLTLLPGQSVTVSPYAPYSALSSQLTLSGAPPWILMEHTPWHLDNIVRERDYDLAYTGLGNDSANPFSSSLDTGPLAPTYPAAPGATLTNGGTANQVLTHTWTWIDKIRLKRRRRRLFGAVPLGDPKNRPQFQLQLNALIGTHPESSLYVNSTGANTAVTSGTTTSLVQLKAHRTDVLPSGVTVPEPVVGMGLTVDAFSPSVPNAGVLVPIPHQDSMLYTSIHQILVNAQLPIRPDYWGFWLTEEQKAARWQFDSAINTLGQYWAQFHDTYFRYPITGHVVADFEGGKVPNLPRETPYEAYVTPDFGYAQSFGLVPTPNMQTAIRVAQGVGINQAYLRNYSFGLVTVPY